MLIGVHGGYSGFGWPVVGLEGYPFLSYLSDRLISLISHFSDHLPESLPYPFPGDTFFLSHLAQGHGFMVMGFASVFAGANPEAF